MPPAISDNGPHDEQNQNRPPVGHAVRMQPVARQPVAPGQQATWMPPQGPISGCPQGLEYLAHIDQLVVKPQTVTTGFEATNNYRVFNNLGQQVYYAKEESEWFMRNCCGPARGFGISIMDHNDRPKMYLKRDFKCCAGGCWCANADCCAVVLQVEAPPGNPIGYVRQEQSKWKPNFCLYTADDQVLARVRGPCCVFNWTLFCTLELPLFNFRCCGDLEFTVMSPDDSNQLGKMTKQWSEAHLHCITKLDTFFISFPMDMDVGSKALMLGALILIDVMHFEKQNY